MSLRSLVSTYGDYRNFRCFCSINATFLIKPEATQMILLSVSVQSVCYASKNKMCSLKPNIFNSVLRLILILVLTTALTQGNPLTDTKLCTKLTPSHIRTEPQPTKSPYAIYLSRTEIHPGEAIVVQLCSSKHKIKEFYVQSRQVPGEDDLPVGTFMPENGYENDTVIEGCGSRSLNSVQQSDASTIKEHVKFRWVAPAEPGVYFLLATIVEDENTFWLRQSSMKIKVRPTEPNTEAEKK